MPRFKKRIPWDRPLIERTLRETGNVSETARRMKMHRRSLQRVLRKWEKEK